MYSLNHILLLEYQSLHCLNKHIMGEKLLWSVLKIVFINNKLTTNTFLQANAYMKKHSCVTYV